jgi:hypothetical protein
MATKSKKRKKPAGAKRRRQRAMPSPHAFAYTVADAASVGGPGKTSLYEADKRLKAEGKRLLFKDGFGRTMVYGDILRELCGVKEEVTA